MVVNHDRVVGPVWGWYQNYGGSIFISLAGRVPYNHREGTSPFKTKWYTLGLQKASIFCQVSYCPQGNVPSPVAMVFLDRAKW